LYILIFKILGRQEGKIFWTEWLTKGN
jgi:hypothetical protein